MTNTSTEVQASLQRAVAAHRAGDLDAAAAHLTQAAAVRPGDAAILLALGRLRRAQGQHAAAEQAFRAAAEADPHSLDTRFDLAQALEAQARWYHADAVLRAAIEAFPERPEAPLRLGQFLVNRPKGGRRRVEEAVVQLRRALAIGSDDARLFADICHDLSEALYLLDLNDESAEICRVWLQRQPDAAVARHRLASLGFTDAPARADDDYVRQVFDQFADSFDDKLVGQLKYRAPEALVAALAERIGDARGELDILDAGCGTGLCGPLLRPFARQLTGVDLSLGMVEKAHGRGYDRLDVAELTAHLARFPAAFDTVVSADTLVYFGDLGEVVAASRRALRDGGWFAFSLESCEGDGFEIGVSGRYRHSPAHVRRVLRDAGFGAARILPDHLRWEGGQPVPGLVVVAQAGVAAAADPAPGAAPAVEENAAADAPDLHHAVQLLQQGHAAAAERELVALLRADAANANALHFLGLLRQQQGRGDDAVALIERALVLQPAYADARFNLAAIHAQAGRDQEALDAYATVIDHTPDFHRAYAALADLLERLEMAEQAIAVRRNLLQRHPDHPDNANRLAMLLAKSPDRDTEQLEEAVACFRLAVASRPDDPAPVRNLAVTLYTLARYDEAAAAFHLLLERSPGDAFAEHMLAAFGHGPAPERASDAYVRTLFERFSGRFDQHLVDKLAYHGPEKMLALLTRTWPTGTAGLDIFDAGCGTGLCGPLLRPFARTLTGIDLAAGMIDHAILQDEYDRLEVAEITQWLEAHDGAYDLVWITDTLIYFGNLLQLLSVSAGALREQGWLAFTVEQMPEDRPGDHELDVNGRYRHSRGYLERVLDATGFDIAALDGAPLRQERGQPVQAWYVVARRRAGSVGGGVSVKNPRSG